MGRKRINEENLFQAALMEFSQNSFEEASVNKVIDAAGISKGSFYYRYKTKFDLYAYLILEANRRKWDFIQKESETNPQDQPPGDIFEIFLQQTHLGLKFAELNPELHKLTQMFVAEKDSESYKKIIEMLGVDERSGLEQMVQTAIQNGDISKSYPQEVAFSIIRHLFQNYREIFPEREMQDYETGMEKMRYLVRFMKHGLNAIF